jgi:hypothetical protein
VFIAVFSIFIAATLVLVVMTLRWSILRDRERRASQVATDTTTEKTP